MPEQLIEQLLEQLHKAPLVDLLSIRKALG
jgi:hypothetical protein